MAAISVRDIPQDAWEAFKEAAQAEGSNAETKIREWVVREGWRWRQTVESHQVVAKAMYLRRHDGELMHGSLTLRVAVVQHDWEAVAYLALEQVTAHGTSALDSGDWTFLRSEAKKDGVDLDLIRRSF